MADINKNVCDCAWALSCDYSLTVYFISEPNISRLAPREKTAEEAKMVLKDLYHGGYSVA